MRVLHLQPMTLDLYGHDDRDLGEGVRYSVFNLCAAQARAGMHPVLHLLTAEDPRVETLHGVEVHFHASRELFPGGSADRRFARQFSLSFLSAVRRGLWDVVHFHGVRQFHAMMAGVAWNTERAGVPLVLQDRGARPVGRVESALQRFAVGRASLILTASHDTANLFKNRGVTSDYLGQFPNGYDQEVFNSEGRRGPPDPDRARLLAVVRWAPEKDPLTLAGAACALRRDGVPLSLTLVSRGPLLADVLSLLQQGGVPFRHVSNLSQAELGKLYRESDLLLLTSLGEGWSQVAVEAMASGLPVVASDVFGVRDALGGAGVLVPPADPEAMANAARRVLADAGRWADLGQRGLERIRGMSWDHLAVQSRALYGRAAANHASAHQQRGWRRPV